MATWNPVEKILYYGAAEVCVCAGEREGNYGAAELFWCVCLCVCVCASGTPSRKSSTTALLRFLFLQIISHALSPLNHEEKVKKVRAVTLNRHFQG